MQVQIPERAASRYDGRYDRTVDVHRLFEILRDSIGVALQSKDEETASARYDLALECYHQLQTLQLPSEIDGKLRAFVETLISRFPTVWRINVAAHAWERAGLAKRIETRSALLDEALAVLHSGRGQDDVEQDEIEALITQIEEHIALLQAAPESDTSGAGVTAVLDADSLTATVETAASEIVQAIDAVESPASEDTRESEPMAEIALEVLGRVHLALLRGRRDPVYSIEVRNVREGPLVGLKLTLTAEPEFFRPTTIEIARLDPGENLTFDQRRLHSYLQYDHALLARLTERAEGAVHAVLTDAEGREVASTTATWVLHTVDSWPGLDALPEVFPALVLPNDPFVAQLLSSAAECLAKHGGDGGLSGYQTKDPMHALHMVQAVYEALQAAQVTYANPPASFDGGGQRVRFPSAIAQTKIATCLDMSLLAAAVLEQAGLHALLVFVEGHAFVGAWLVERTFSNPVVHEPLRIVKRAELAELVLFDPTCATTRPSPPFAEARETAEKRLEDRDAFECAVDVERARRGGVLPLPTFRDPEADGAEATGVPQTTGGRLRPDRDLEADLESYLAAEKLRRQESETPKTRLDRWLRQLLDLTMRNRLLNTATKSKRVVPLLGAHLDVIEDRLADGKTYRALERPSEIEGKGVPDDEARARIEPLLASGAQSGELRSYLDGEELQTRLTNLYRDARTAREEGGANSLFLAVGFLQYRETRQSTKVRRAPLLLVPLEMKRLSGRRGYSLVQGGDETRINVTLLEYLRRDHEVDVTGLDPLPQDDKGVDVALVLRVFKDAVKDEDDWEVVEEAQIGLYSFSKYLLWRDLKDRSDVLRENALVAHLIDRPNEPFEGDVEYPDPHTLDATFGASDVFAPMSYDSTQLSAILAASRGRTMVLEGPPGTGKSQTITNLIAHAIAQGKTVLFVSEKMAALDVVHRRLRGLGLGPACLELHSNKANKKGVLEQFKASLDEGRVRGAKRRKWSEIGDDVDRSRARLNDHVTALHDARRSGESIHEVVARMASRAGDALLELELDLDDPRDVDESTLHGWRSALDEVDVTGSEQLVGPEHPLLRVGRKEYSPILEDETRAALLAHDAPASEFLAAGRDVLVGLGLVRDDGTSPAGVAAPATEGAWDTLHDLAAALVDPPDFGDATHEVLSGSPAIEQAGAAVAAARDLAGLQAGFDRSFRVSPTTLDIAALETARRKTVAGGLFGFFTRWGAKRELIDAFRGIANDTSSIRIDTALRALDEVQRVRELTSEVDAVSDSVRAILTGVWNGADTDAPAAEARIDRARVIAACVEAYCAQTDSKLESLSKELRTVLGTAGDDLASTGGVLARHFEALDEARASYGRALAATLEAAEPNGDAPLGASLNEVAALQASVLRWADRWSDLRGWTRWQAVRAQAVEVGLQRVVAGVETGTVTPGQVRAAFDATFARSWVLHEISADGALKAFDGPDHERAVERFVALDDERLDAAREEVRQRIAAKRPQPRELREKKKGTALGTLQREITKKTRHLAIRRLLSELGELAMDLKPCFLMSPMSVAQYLEADHARFDLVVFDEASQIPVWDAIGAIARGKQAVIVGDPKQLPPTSFFDRGEDESIEEDEIQDLESILEECIGAQVPTQRLAWHYRSRHESLIAFSNQRYYDNQLLTFPSNSSEGLGVSAHVVEDGVYDKGKTRTNVIEARAVVAEVVRRLRDPAQRDRSIGVVTFSQAQQTLVLDLFDEAMREHPEIERHFDEALDESVFVKNLENVQGDERDVILFSIGYGPDAKGRVSMNFGPLNRDGGERRLNVAITRAREEVVVFSSIRWDQIDLARTNARAVHDLRAFLAYAQRGATMARTDEASALTHRDDRLVQAIAARLAQKGWDVETEFGASDIRVDLAVRHPERPERFLLGIETDGRNYEGAATARDRDRLRSLVLGGLGWSLARVWTVDWWRDADTEVDRLDGLLRAALDAGRTIANVQGTGATPGGVD